MKSRPGFSIFLVIGILAISLRMTRAGREGAEKYKGFSIATLDDYEHLKYALESAAKSPKEVGERCYLHLGPGLLNLMKKYGGMSAQEMMNVDNSEIAARELELLEIALLKEASRFVTTTTRKPTTTTPSTTPTTIMTMTSTSSTTIDNSTVTDSSNTTSSSSDASSSGTSEDATTTTSIKTEPPTTASSTSTSMKPQLDGDLIRRITQHVYDLGEKFCPITTPMVCAGGRCRECKNILPKKDEQLVAFCKEAEILGKKFGVPDTATRQSRRSFKAFLFLTFCIIICL